ATVTAGPASLPDPAPEARVGLIVGDLSGKGTRVLPPTTVPSGYTYVMIRVTCLGPGQLAVRAPGSSQIYSPCSAPAGAGIIGSDVMVTPGSLQWTITADPSTRWRVFLALR